jgi:hypothetical protein
MKTWRCKNRLCGDESVGRPPLGIQVCVSCRYAGKWGALLAGLVAFFLTLALKLAGVL